MLKVGVLFGGMSIECEVSFNSGRTVCDHLDTARYDIIPIFQTHIGELFILPLHFLHRGKIADFEHRLAQEAKHIAWDDLKSLIDFAYICVHGRFAEDGTLQGFLEVLGIPYLGSKVFASALCMDKVMQKSFLRNANIAVPNDISITPTQLQTATQKCITQQLKERNINLPCIVKPFQEGSSLGVSIVFKANELLPAIQHAAYINETKAQTVLIEEKIEGMEFSCITLTDYKTNRPIPLPPTEIVPEENAHFFDYEQKYMPGRASKFTPPRCSAKLIKQIQNTCLRAADALGITNIARIDGFVTADERIIIVDPNTLSGMGPASFLFREAAEINIGHTQLINHLIETELHSYGMLDAIIQAEQKMEKAHIHKKRIAILMGGNSNEKEISLESGRNITYKVSPQEYEALPIFVSSTMQLYTLNQSLLVRNSCKEIESLINESMQIKWHDLPKLVDFVFIGLHGGAGENGSVQGTLEMLGLPYNGSGVLTSALCMDKYKTNTFLQSHGFDVPRSLLIAHNEWHTDKTNTLTRIFTHLNPPLIVKPHDDGCSVMVQKITTKAALVECIEQLFAHNKEYALIEEVITGMELTVGVYGNENPIALPPSQAVVKKDILSIEEKFLPGAGENQTPAPLPKKALSFVQTTIEHVYKQLGCKGYTRIDCFYQTAEQSPTKKERVVILEINTLPGMTPATCIFHQAAEVGMRPMDFIDKIIKLGMQEHAIEQKIVKRKKQQEKQ
jgi:D-alanine-D-alanine ligase/UDP-N-acetylmuramate--alanine ligase